MSKYEARSEKPALYEQVLPAVQFKTLVRGALGSAEPFSSEIARDTRRMTWSDESADNHYGVEIRTHDDVPMGSPTASYIFDEYIGTKPGEKITPTRRYVASDTYGSSTHRISVLDKGRDTVKLSHEERGRIMRQVLGTLMKAVSPGVAWQAVNSAMDARYESIVGDYILSDNALDDDSNYLDPVSVWKAVENHKNHIDDIEIDALKVARQLDSETNGQSFYSDSVDDAITTRPQVRIADRFAQIDTHTVANSAADEMNLQWDTVLSHLGPNQ